MIGEIAEGEELDELLAYWSDGTVFHVPLSFPSRDVAVARLDALLPGQSRPWLLKDPTGDVMAYFDLDDVSIPGALAIAADISGRHYHCHAEVVSLLVLLSSELGGSVERNA